MPHADLRVALTRRLPEPVERRLAELFAVLPSPDDAPMDTEALARAAEGADVLVCTVGDRIDAPVIARGRPRG